MTHDRKSALSLRGAWSTIAALFLFAAGCTDGKTFIATASDYASYRATRVGPTLEDRVSAASTYLGRHPHGAYVDEVRAYFARAEPFFYARSEKSVAGLMRYLDLLPSGPHAEVAKDALAFMRHREGLPDDLLTQAASTRLRLETNARSRAYARSELSSWLERAMTPGAFSSPMSEAPKELLVPFSLSLPEAHCAPVKPQSGGVVRRCSKLLSLPYVIPVKRKFEEHELTFEVAIEMTAETRPRRIVIAGPDLFLRLQETYAKSASPTELESRIDAVERAVDTISGAFEAKVSVDPTCSEDVAAPDVVHLHCSGLDVVGTLAGGPDGDDVIVITPVD